jgi:uncharacterized protein (DUF1499 family)
MRKTLFIFLGILIGALLLTQFGVLKGTPPDDLGVHAQRLKPPSQTRNSVSSQATLYPGHPQLAYAEIQPLPLKNGSASTSMTALLAALQGLPGISVVEQRPDYIYAQAQTPWLKFVDDLEFWVNPQLGVIDVRSASRLGREDFGVNRQRIEAIRAAYLAQP